MGQFDTGFKGRVRNRSRKKWLLALIGVLLCGVGMIGAIGITHGFSWLRDLFTIPSLEASSGKKYTPTGAVKRYIEKLDEKE